MDQIELVASPRAILGKKVRFLRREGLTPTNLYGRNVESIALQIETSQLKQTLSHAGKTRLISLKVDGTNKPTMVIVRQIQRHPLNSELVHVDFYQVRMEEKIKLDIPLLLVGTAPAVKDQGGILVQIMNTVEVECLPANMPQNFEVDLSGLMELDQAVYVKDLRVGDDITVLTDPEKAMVQITRRRIEVEVVKAPKAEEEAEAAAEAEGKEKAEAAESTEKSAEKSAEKKPKEK